MDVVAKEGSMFLQGVKFGKRIWRRTWVMLFEPSPAGIGRIEMYDMRDGTAPSARPAGLKKADKQVLRLTDCLSVTPAPGESCPTDCTAFYLNTTKRIYTLAAPARDEWVPALCRLAFQRNEGGGETRREQRAETVTMAENDLYSTWCPTQFQVRVASSMASVRCSMSGSYLLSPEKESLCLLDMKTGQVMFHWPYRFLRKFGPVKDGVSIEAGRRCHTGEGQFIFLTTQGQQIYRAIEEAVMHQSVQDLLSKATSFAEVHTTKQPPPVPPPASRSFPKKDVKMRNLPLPRLPGPKPRPSGSKPKAEEVVYSSVKPLPKPRTKPPVPVPPVPKPETAPQTSSADPDNEEHDYEVCDWTQKPESRQDQSNTQLYSVVTHHNRKQIRTGVQQQDSQRPLRVPPSETLKNFRQTLSDTLFKGRTRVCPPVPPKPPRQTSDHDFNDYELLNELDRF
ncbi:docking protein 3 [Trichomycterus rosablanca]|uniref:docking protein 3 n=1 Tax=Trichomycterus rosablanca TaxID=2290929 RepID=UPI002F353ECA